MELLWCKRKYSIVGCTGKGEIVKIGIPSITQVKVYKIQLMASTFSFYPHNNLVKDVRLRKRDWPNLTWLNRDSTPSLVSPDLIG